MIRREHLNSTTEIGNAAEHAAEAVKRGESVRIVGLGTLGRRRYCHDTHVGYRLTLTAAAAKLCHHPNPQARAVLKEWRDLLSDVRNLARAIGEQVEVWAPGKHGMVVTTHNGPTLITTVQP